MTIARMKSHQFKLKLQHGKFIGTNCYRDLGIRRNTANSLSIESDIDRRVIILKLFEISDQNDSILFFINCFIINIWIIFQNKMIEKCFTSFEQTESRFLSRQSLRRKWLEKIVTVYFISIAITDQYRKNCLKTETELRWKVPSDFCILYRKFHNSFNDNRFNMF